MPGDSQMSARPPRRGGGVEGMDAMLKITPLPQFEADLAADATERDAEQNGPSTLVVRFGSTRMIGEFAFDAGIRPGCGSRVVVRTHRGTELGEVLTSTCPNAGCGKSVSRQEMLEYIDRSGGQEYPFFTEGRVLRIATTMDMAEQARLEESRAGYRAGVESLAEQLGLNMRIVDIEPILGGERLTVYFASEHRVDFRELVRQLAAEHRTRIEMRQVGARDEARLTADYEKCGQHCCCRQFLKVLKPVSMKSAKTQKATLDPLKISGRCGRLMCCLRYEDQTYSELKKRLPHKRTRVGTPEGPGVVLDTQILTQLVLVRLEADERHIAVPVENLTDPDQPPPELVPAEPAAQPTTEETTRRRRRRRRKRPSRGEDTQGPRPTPSEPAATPEESGSAPPPDDRAATESKPGGPRSGGARPKRRRRRRKRRGSGGADSAGGNA